MNPIYHDKLLTFIRATFRKKLGSHHQVKFLNNFESIKAVSDTVLDRMNLIYREKLFIFIGATFREKLVSHHRTVNINC